MINVRRLAAVDLAFLGPKIILPEFALGVVGPLALGALTLSRSHSAPGVLFGVNLIALRINYVPLPLHAVGIVRHGNPGAEIAEEADDRSQLFGKCRRQSLWLLVPLVVAIVAVLQVRRTGVDS